MKKSPWNIVLFLFLILFTDINTGFSRDQKELSRKYLLLANTNFSKARMDSADFYFRKILRMKGLDDTIIGKVNTRLCLVYRKKGDYEKAMSYGKTALNICQAAHDSAGIMEATIALAKVYNVLGDNKTTMDYYFGILPFVERQKDTLNRGKIYISIANVYMDIEQEDKGIEYYRKAIDILATTGKESDIADELNNLGIAYYDQGKYDSALYYYKRSMHAYQTEGWQDAIGASMQNIGITLVKMGRSREGLRELHRAYEIFERLKLERDKLSVLIDLGTAFIDTGESDSAGYYLDRALHLADSLKHTYYRKMALWNLYQLYHSQNKPGKALQAYQDYISFKDSIDNMEMKKSFIEIETKYKTSEKEKEIQQLKYQKRIADANLKLLLIAIVTFVIIVLLIIRMLILKRRKDLQIHQQKMLVYEKEKKLAEAELAERNVRERQLADELEFKTRQLATHAMNMMHKNMLLSDVTEAITERMKTVDDKGKAGLRDIKRKLEQSLSADKDWELFKMYFEQINKDFFVKLKQINPNLTTNDYRLAALTKLNLSIKEMASVLNISPNSLKNARYRLKKKLQLTDNDSLNSVIRNL